MLYFFFSIVFASIPSSAWRAAEREHYQEAVYDEVKIVELLSSACKEKHRPSCQWKKKRKKIGHNLEEKRKYFSESCKKGEPWSCVISGWHHSQLPNLPGLPNAASKNVDKAESQFSQACEAGEDRGCLELIKLQFVTEKISSFETILQDLEKYCTNKDAEACYTLGYFHAQAIGTTENKTKAEELFNQACQNGLGKGCSNQALIMLDRASNFELAKEVVSLYKQGCELGSSDSCRWLGQHFEEGLGTERSEKEAAKYYEIACTSYHPEACDKLGLLYSEGRGVEQDSKKASSLFEKGCEAQNPFSCYNLAALLEAQETPNLEKARSLLSKSCVYGSGRACFTYGLWQENGKGGAVEAELSLQSYGRGCELNYGPACLNGGIISYKQKSFEQAATLYEKGCGLGEMGACASFGLLLETGEGVAANNVLAGEYYKKACDVGDQRSCERFHHLQGDIETLYKNCTKQADGKACYDAALRYEQGKYNVQNLTSAAELAGIGCQKKYYRACSKLAYYYLEGLGVDQDESNALKFYKLACNNKETSGCHSLGLLYTEGRGVEQNVQTAFSYLNQACELGQGSSCGVIALLHRMQTPPNIQEALKYAQKGCEIGDLDSCSQEAFIYTQPPRTDLPKAAALFKKYCSLNHAKSCFNCAFMLYNGQGVSIDKDQSLKVMEYSCALGYQEACKTLGN